MYLLDLVCWIGNRCYNMIRTFVNIFKKVFDTMNIDKHLNINMCIKHLGKVRVVRHHLLVVVRKAIWSFLKCLTIISPTVDRVTIFTLCCLFRESLWIMFLAYIVDHVRCVGVFLAAWSMQQTFCDNFKKRCVLRMRKLH